MANHKLLTKTLLRIFITTELCLSQPLRRLLATLTVCLLEGVEAHLTDLAEALPDIETSQSAKEQRIRRFLSNARLSPSVILPVLIFLLRPLLEILPSITITMDRTHWRKRKCDVNILMVAIAFENRAIPIFWIVFNRAGNSSFENWKKVLAPVIEILQAQSWLKEKIITVVADREFGSPKLSQWLKTTYGVETALRLKRSNYLNDIDLSIKLSELLQHFPKGTTRFYPNITVTKKSDFKMNVLITWQEKYDEPLILATTFYQEQLPSHYYKKRFGIEPMFKDDKSNGFNIEQTKVTDAKRIENLWIPIALAHAFSTIEGFLKEQNNETIMKKKVFKVIKLIKLYK